MVKKYVEDKKKNYQKLKHDVGKDFIFTLINGFWKVNPKISILPNICDLYLVLFPTSCLSFW